MKKSSEGEFLLTGVFESTTPLFKFTEKHKVLITQEIKILKRDKVDQFLSSLESAANLKRRADELRSDIKLSIVRDRVEDIRKLSSSLLKELARSDGHTWDLFAVQGRGPTRSVPTISEKDGVISYGEDYIERAGMNLSECTHAVFTLQHFAIEALGKLPSKYSGKKQKSLNNMQFGVDVAKAMDQILGVKPVPGGKQLLSRLLVLLLYILEDSPREGTDPFARDVRGLVKKILNSYQAEL